jgi:hypothetical protein
MRAELIREDKRSLFLLVVSVQATTTTYIILLIALVSYNTQTNKLTNSMELGTTREATSWEATR